MRRIAILALFLAVTLPPGLARAQVAAPSLVPAAPSVIDPQQVPDTGFTTANPAVMQWSDAGRLGFGQITAERDNSAPAEDESWSGYHVGLRWLGESWGFGLEQVSLGRTEPDTDFSTRATNAAVSLGVNDMLSFGGSLHTGVREDGFRDAITGNALGASLRFQEQFFFGVVFGNDHLDHTDGTDYDDSRGVTRYGIGMRTEGEVMWHLEYNTSEKDSWDTPGGAQVGGESGTQAVVEALLGSFLLGGRLVTIQRNDADETVSAQMLDVGWVPGDSGLSVVGHVEQTTVEDDNSGDTTEIATTAITVAYLF